MTEFHAELAFALRTGAQLATETKHAVKTTIRVYREVLGPNFGIVDDGVALVEEADDVTLELVGCRNGCFHEGFEDLGCTGSKGLAEGLLGCRFKGHFGRIDGVSGTVIDDHGSAQDSVAKQGPLYCRCYEALFARKKEFLGDGAARDLLLKLVLGKRLSGLHPTDDAGVVAGATTLLLERVIEVYALCYGFAIGDLGLTCLALDAVFAAHTLNVNVEMEFAHAGDDRLL